MRQKSWYPVENGKFIIEINVASIHQLFDERDPAPFRLRDLDDDAVEYIVASALDIGLNKIGRIRIYCNEALGLAEKAIVKQAVREHFIYRVELTQKKFQHVLKQGFKSLLIGLCFLSAAVFASSLMALHLPDSFLTKLLKEGLLLLGWVSMWKPINIFLYDWWPLRDEAKVYLKISETPLEFVKTESTPDNFKLMKNIIVSPNGNKIA